MKGILKAAFAAAALCAFAATAAAQTAATGFNAQELIVKLSLFLPEDIMGGPGMFGAGRAGAQPGQAGAGGAPATGAQAQGSGTGAQAGAQAQGGQTAQGQAARQQFQYTRNQKLFLTKDQTVKLLPIVQGLRDNPLPSPTKAKKIESDVALILTAEQKAEYEKYLKAMEKFRQDLQQNRTAAGNAGAGGQRPQDFQNMTDAQRQEFINSLPADQRQRFQSRAAQGAGTGGTGGTGGGQLTETERRQRQLDEFIKVLQEWQKKAK
jgi:hypothetical protein